MTNQVREEDSHMIFNYNNVFFSCFYEDDRMCTHRSKEFALNYVYSGEMVIDDGTHQVRVGKGECVFVPRDLRITLYKQPKDGERYQGIFVNFPREQRRQAFESLGANSIPRNTPRLDPGALKLPKTAELESLFTSLMPYFDSTVKPNDDIMRLKQLEGILALIHIDPRFGPTLFDFSESWKIDILDFMNENYMQELTTEDMANYTGRSLASFKRDFKKVSDMTPEKWLVHKRLQVAYEMIEEGRMKVVDICYKVGFKNPSHFSTAFKKQYGMTPTMAYGRGA